MVDLTPQKPDVAIWLPPRSEFAEWCEFIGGQPAGLETYEDCEALIREHAASHGVQVVPLNVAEMSKALARAGLENTTENRAAVAAAAPCRVGLTIGHHTIGWSAVRIPGEPLAAGTAATISEAVEAGAQAIRRHSDG